ncbi:hypothetical protein DAI22_01g400700 [Oryza sativa Japonica Group]|nr:hypothetical protein DAI22_01g400700 [Oryza sativa Japonica Group]
MCTEHYKVLFDIQRLIRTNDVGETTAVDSSTFICSCTFIFSVCSLELLVQNSPFSRRSNRICSIFKIRQHFLTTLHLRNTNALHPHQT